MKIVVGLRHGAGTFNFDVDWSDAEVLDRLSGATTENKVLDLTDVKGERMLIPASSIAYISVPKEEERKVGFVRA